MNFAAWVQLQVKTFHLVLVVIDEFVISVIFVFVLVN